MTRIITLTLLAFAISVSPASAQVPATIPTQGLNAGDEIRIVVWRKPELSGDFPISADGSISHPLYREVQVMGISLPEVESRLRTFLLRYEAAPQFVVQPLLRIIVGGEVRTPNIQSLPPETTIAQAIALAGGPTERGLLDRVRLIRDRQVMLLDLSRPESDVGLLQIRSGDQILVGRRRRNSLEIIAPITSSIAAIAAIVSILVR